MKKELNKKEFWQLILFLFAVIIFALSMGYSLHKKDLSWIVGLAGVIIYGTLVAVLYATKPYKHEQDIILGRQSSMANEFNEPLRKLYFPVQAEANGRMINFVCLIDTGSTSTLHISKKIADELQLKSEGEVSITALASKEIGNIHHANIKLGGITFKNVQITSTQKELSDNEYEQGIIGMQLISYGQLKIEKVNNKFHYSFQI